MSTGGRLSWYAHRLRAMSAAEIMHRMAERARRFTLGGYLKRAAGIQPGPVNARAPFLPDPAAAPQGLREALAVEAAALQAGKWKLFGWHEAEVGAPPCWHRDARCGVVIEPKTVAHRLDHRNLPDGADARTIWEINRWAEMTRLAMHGWLNADKAAIRAAQLWLEDWLDHNPPGMGINWTSPLEAALRLINFCWFDALARAAGADASAQDELARRIVPVHAGWVWRHRSRGSSANNHLLGELAALVVALKRWPGMERHVQDVEQVWDMLGAEVLAQFAEDGGSREQALHYHLFAFDLAWQAVRAVGCRAGEVHDRLAEAADYFHCLAHPDEPWDFGDNDDAQVVPVTRSRERAAAEWRAWMAGEPGDLRFWLGRSPRSPARVEEAGWRCFPESGMVVGRMGGWMARLDASPLGFRSLAAHGHCDALHLSVWDGAHALLIDPGTGGYYGHQNWRAELASWEMHNAPLPPAGYRTPRRCGTFLLTRHHEPPLPVCEGWQAAARFSHEGRIVQRTVLMSGNAVEIHDVEASGKPLTVRWCLAPQVQAEIHEAGAMTRLSLRRGTAEWSMELHVPAEKVTLKEARCSPAYARVETCAQVRVSVEDGKLVSRLRRM